MNRLLGLLLLVLFCSGCRYESKTVCDPSLKYLPVKPDELTMMYTNEALAVINSYTTELAWYHQIWLENAYVQIEDDGKMHVWVDFNTQANEEIPGARKLSVKVIDGLLAALNASTILAPVGPFTPDILYFSIEYTSYYGVYVDTLLVGRSELQHGYMNMYYAHDAFQIDPVYYHKHSEPYETSQKIVAVVEKVESRLKPTRESIYDRLVSPEDWFGGEPDYIRKAPEAFDAYEYRYKTTLSNYPRYGVDLPSGDIETISGGKPGQPAGSPPYPSQQQQRPPNRNP